MYIKLFEEFGEKYYHRMDNNELREILPKMKSKALKIFNKKEIHEILSFFRPEVKKEIRKKEITIYFDDIEHIYICKLEDDYYVLFYSDRQYICDQLDGLTQWIEDFIEDPKHF